ncbi:enoyl-CoA hydratase/isomerase family protein [Hydrogenophaga crocea]|uniref:Enoyl-CoA hydratase/isomerase family protein n=1 Tax=Hydrogenophaga crocea TaxID=2716225 RepID=A0A6G8IJ17_9BURK|nr:enoyl-CoA hydratase/isomerase family protein [Hydrogenophaga crocea]QIM53194.1 enoyl-CoA hydratase/isomerase family protein [Hydrogenophaga crocea]
MSYQTISTRKEGPAFVIELNRPERRNAVSEQMMDDIMAAFLEVEARKDVSAIVISGGKDYFSAGADLNEAFQVKTAQEGRRYFSHWHRLNDALEQSSKPVIAAIEGFCMTGGLELALAADLRVASENATFAITSARIGTVAGAGGTQRLPRVVGLANALDMLFAAEPIESVEALRIGLINRRVANGKTLETALAMARHYASRAPLALAFVKRAVHRGMQMDLTSAIEFETMLVTTVYGTADKAEGISAFLDKRTAQFKGE